MAGIEDYRERIKEEARLSEAVDEFARAMIEKLRSKSNAGYRGWDQKASIPLIKELFFKHVERLKNGENQEVDIANLVMMLWLNNPKSERVPKIG